MISPRPTSVSERSAFFCYRSSAEMPVEISSETKAAILTARPLFNSPGKISGYLKSIRRSVSSSSVHRVLKKYDEEKSGVPPRVKRLPAHQRPYKCTKSLLRKVAKAAFVKNPPTQVALARTFKVSRATIQKVMKQLQAQRIKKQKHHSLTEKQKEQRVHRGKSFIKYLSRRKLQLMVSMDEMNISTDDIDGLTNFYYKEKDVVVPDEWKILPRQNWPKRCNGCDGDQLEWNHSDLYRPE